jgi:hypothetical protein
MRLTITPAGGATMVVGATSPVTTSGGLPPGGAVLGAFAEFTNGERRYVEATWTSSDERILVVGNEAFVARGRGTAAVSATFDGQTDSETFIVDGGFFGRWAGSYVVEQCLANSGSMDDLLCRPAGGGRSGLAPVGATLPMTLEISDVSGDDIRGRVTLGQIDGVLPGKNRGGGFFSLNGEVTSPGGVINFMDWNMRGLRDVMEGVFGYQIRVHGIPGAGAVVGRLSNMTRQ